MQLTSTILKYKYALAWAINIFILCTLHPSKLPKLEITFEFGIDKVAHFILFGVQALLILLPSFNKVNGAKLFTAFFLGSFYGVLIEVIQGLFFANRTFDYADMLANTLGAAFFTLLFYGATLIKKF